MLPVEKAGGTEPGLLEQEPDSASSSSNLQPRRGNFKTGRERPERVQQVAAEQGDSPVLPVYRVCPIQEERSAATGDSESGVL